MTTYTKLTPKIQFETRYFLCCCLESRATTSMNNTNLTVSTEYFNIFGCDTGTDTQMFHINSIGSVETSIGCWCDPTPYNMLSYLTKKYNCARTTVRVNSNGVVSKIRVNQKHAYLIQDWWAPGVQEMH